MITVWPRSSLSLSASRRPTKSVGPPAGNAITILIGRVGKSCAAAGLNISALAITAPPQYLRKFKSSSLTDPRALRLGLYPFVANNLAPARGLARNQVGERIR